MKYIKDLLQLELEQEKRYEDFVPKDVKRNSGSLRKFINFCRKILFLSNKEIDWSANVWYVEGLHLDSKRESQGNNILTFSFLDIANYAGCCMKMVLRYLLYENIWDIRQMK